jgi:DNA-binding MarR family transcriptional regulator
MTAEDHSRDMYKLTDSVPYLLNRAGVQIGDIFTDRIVEDDISVSMYRVLAMLKQVGQSTLSDLADVVSVEISTLSRLVGTLAKRKLVSRTRPDDNGRIVIIKLTAQGEALTDRLMPLAIELEKTAVQGMSDDEIATLKNALRRMHANLSGAAGT